MKIKCMNCNWKGDEDDLRPSWPVNTRTVDEPYDICPECGSEDVEEIEDA